MDSFDLVTDPVFHINIAGRPIRGNPNAKVTVVNFDDLECPFCAAALGIHQVPTLYVNGERIDGALPQNQIWEAIDRALRAEGVTPPSPQTAAKTHRRSQ